MASLAFTDADGAATLESARPAPANRFRNFAPDRKDDAARATAKGTGRVSSWRFRRDHVAALELPYLAADDTAVALRLKAHLMDGGEVTVTTGDAAARVYTCTIRPDTEPTWACEDRQAGDWTFACALRNTADAPLVCDYWS